MLAQLFAGTESGDGGPKKILGGNHAISRTCSTHIHTRPRVRRPPTDSFSWRSCLAFVGQGKQLEMLL